MSANRTIFAGARLLDRHASERRRHPFASVTRAMHYEDANAKARYLSHLLNGLPSAFLDCCAWTDIAPIVRRASA